MPFDFRYKTLDDVREDLLKLGINLPLSEDLSPLARNFTVKGEKINFRNAVAIHPMEGFDSIHGEGEAVEGAPSDLTHRRYMRFADSDAGLYWFEAVAISRESRSNNRQLWIHRENVDSFKRLIDDFHEKTDGAPVICQLTHSGRFSRPENKPAPIIAYHNPVLNKPFNIPPKHPVVTDDYLDSLVDQYVTAAKLAKEAGFDGVDIKACHRYLMSELLSAYTREGKYGGSFENRTRLYRDVISAVKAEVGDMAVATRLGVHDGIGYPYGFGDDREDSRSSTRPRRKG